MSDGYRCISSPLSDIPGSNAPRAPLEGSRPSVQNSLSDAAGPDNSDALKDQHDSSLAPFYVPETLGECCNFSSIVQSSGSLVSVRSQRNPGTEGGSSSRPGAEAKFENRANSDVLALIGSLLNRDDLVRFSQTCRHVRHSTFRLLFHSIRTPYENTEENRDIPESFQGVAQHLTVSDTYRLTGITWCEVQTITLNLSVTNRINDEHPLRLTENATGNSRDQEIRANGPKLKEVDDLFKLSTRCEHLVLGMNTFNQPGKDIMRAAARMPELLTITCKDFVDLGACSLQDPIVLPPTVRTFRVQYLPAIFDMTIYSDLLCLCTERLFKLADATLDPNVLSIELYQAPRMFMYTTRGVRRPIVGFSERAEEGQGRQVRFCSQRLPKLEHRPVQPKGTDMLVRVTKALAIEGYHLVHICTDLASTEGDLEYLTQVFGPHDMSYLIHSRFECPGGNCSDMSHNELAG